MSKSKHTVKVKKAVRTRSSKEETAERILVAASEMFFKNGLEETTFAQIAKKVGVTQPLIYAHFKNKMDLLRGVCIRAVEQGQIFIGARVAQGATASDRFKSYIQSNLEFFNLEREHAHSISALYYFAGSSPMISELFNHIQNAAVDRMEKLLIQAQAEGQFSKADVKKAIRAIHSMLVGDCYKIAYSQSKGEASRIKESNWQATLLHLERG